MGNKNKHQQPQQQNPTQLLDNMLAEKLLNTKFECTEEVRAHIQKLQYQLQKGNISLEQLCPNKTTFDHLVALPLDSELSLLDASYFLNCTARLIPSVIGLNVNEYQELLEANNTAVIAWNEIVMPIKTSSMREIEAKFSRKIIMPNNNLKLHN